MCRAMSARCNQPSTVFTSHQITYTVKARGKTVTRPLIASVKIFRMGQSSHVQDRGAAAALHVIFRPIVVLGACLSVSREPRWQGRVSVRCSWAWPTPLDSARGADAADAPAHGHDGLPGPNGCTRAKVLANPSYPCRFPLMRRCTRRSLRLALWAAAFAAFKSVSCRLSRLLIGYLPNRVGSANLSGKSAAVAATRNTQTGSLELRDATVGPRHNTNRNELQTHLPCRQLCRHCQARRVALLP